MNRLGIAISIITFALIAVTRSTLAVNLPISTLTTLPAPSASPSDSVLVWNSTTGQGNKTFLYDLVNLTTFQPRLMPSPSPSSIAMDVGGVWVTIPFPSPSPSGQCVSATGTGFTLTSCGGGGISYAADTGTASAYVIAPTPASVSYAAGNSYAFLSGNANSGASTLNVSSLGVKSIKNPSGGALVAGDILASQIVVVTYDGTNFQLVSPQGPAVSANTANAIVKRDGSGNFSAGTVTGALSGNATTATNLAGALAIPTPSPAGLFLETTGTAYVNGQPTIQEQSAASPTPSPVATIEAPNFQMTGIGSSTSRIETGSDNLLTNPSFQAPNGTSSVPGWVLSGGGQYSGSTITYNGEPAIGIKVGSGGGGGSLMHQDVNVSNAQSENFENSMTVYNPTSGVSGLQVCPRINGTVTSPCVSIPQGSFFQYSPASVAGTSSTTSVGVDIGCGGCTFIGASNTFYIAKAYVGPNRNIGTVAQAQFYGDITWNTPSNAWSQTGHTSFSSFGVVAGSPTSAATGNAIAPATAVPGIKFASMPPGDYYIVAGGVFSNLSATSGQSVWRFFDGTNGSTQSGIQGSSVSNVYGTSAIIAGHISYTSPQTNVTLSMQSYSGVSGDTQTINGSVGPLTISVYYFPTQAQAVQSVQNTIDRTGEYMFVAGSCPVNTVATNGKIIGLSSGDYQGAYYFNLYAKLWGQAGISTTAGQPYVLSSAAGASAVADWAAGKTITINLGGYFLRNSGGSSPNTAGSLGAQQLDQMQGHSHTATAVFMSAGGGGTGASTGGGALFSTPVMGDPTSDGTNGTPRFGLENRPINTAATLCLNPQPQAPTAILTGGVSTNAAGNWRVESATLNCSSSSSISAAGTGFISSVGNISGNQCVANFASAFSAAPLCSSTFVGSQSTLLINVSTVSTTTSSVTFGCVFSSGSSISNCTSYPANISCQGPR